MAPKPVVIPQPNKHALSRGALGLTATIDTSETTVYWEKVEVPICEAEQSAPRTSTKLIAECKYVQSGKCPSPCIGIERYRQA